MQGRKQEQEALFYFGSLDSLVPEDDPFRRLDAILDLSWLRRETRSLYSAVGAPSIDPVVIAKLMLILYFEGLGSERELMRQVQVNLSYRRFLHYGLSERLPDHSNLTRARQRLGEATIRKLFEYVLRLCLDAGLIGGRLQSIDSTFVQANASLSSLRPRLVAVEAERITKQLFGGEGSVEEEDEQGGPPAKKRRRRNDDYTSKTDPDSSLYRRQGIKARLGYLVHFAVDKTSSIVTAVLTTGAEHRDAAQLLPLVDEVRDQGIAVEAVTADGGYSSGEVYHGLAERDITAFIPQQSPGAERQGRFGQDRFTYDREADSYICPNGSRLKRQKRRGTRRRYMASARDCRSCPLHDLCTTAKARMLEISPYEAELAAARKLQQTPAAKRAARDRRILSERSFAEAKDNHGLRRADQRGRPNVHIQALLTATAMNLKRYLRAQTQVFPAAAALRLACNSLNRRRLQAFSARR
jgi:transposase